jgi:hypothetical protein
MILLHSLDMYPNEQSMQLVDSEAAAGFDDRCSNDPFLLG